MPVCRYKAEAERIVKNLHTQLDRLLADQTQTDDRAKAQVGPALRRSCRCRDNMFKFTLIKGVRSFGVLMCAADGLCSVEHAAGMGAACAARFRIAVHIHIQDLSSPACAQLLADQSNVRAKAGGHSLTSYAFIAMAGRTAAQMLQAPLLKRCHHVR